MFGFVEDWFGGLVKWVWAHYVTVGGGCCTRYALCEITICDLHCVRDLRFCVCFGQTICYGLLYEESTGVRKDLGVVEGFVD